MNKASSFYEFNTVRYSTRVGPGSLTNIRLSRKFLPGTNAPALFNPTVSDEEKKILFIYLSTAIILLLPLRVMKNYFDHCVISKLRQGTQKLMGEHLKVVWAKLSTLN